jgi:hypothetical protein
MGTKYLLAETYPISKGKADLDIDQLIGGAI